MRSLISVFYLEGKDISMVFFPFCHLLQMPFAYCMRTRSQKVHEDAHSVQGRSLSVKHEQNPSVWKNVFDGLH